MAGVGDVLCVCWAFAGLPGLDESDAEDSAVFGAGDCVIGFFGGY